MRTLAAFALLTTALPIQAQVTGPVDACEGDVVVYNVTPITGASYSWSITGGTILGVSNADSAVIQWGAPGTGTIVVTVNPPTGSPIFHTLNVNIHPKPTPLITHDPYPTCPGDTSDPGGAQPDKGADCEKVCKFSTITYCTQLNAGSTYQWIVTGHVSVTGTSTNCVVVTWDSTLIGTLTVIETNVWGCVDSAELCVEKIDLPVASFTSLSNVCRFASTLFTNTSTGATSYLWDFGDGNTQAINSNPGHATHAYSTPGTYTVTLIAYNDCYCTDTFQRVINVDSFPGPEIECVETVCAGDTAMYCTPAVSGCSYNWFVTGGAIISGAGTPCITVAWGAGQLGTVGLQLTGCSGVCDDTTIVQIPIVPLTGVITGPDKVCPGECHTFSLPKFSGATYTWDLTTHCNSMIVDSTNCEEIKICFDPLAFTCNDTLTVSFWNDFLGCGGTAEHVIRIRPELFIAGVSPVCSNQPASFFTGGGQLANWSISPAGPSLSSSPASGVTIDWLGLTGNFLLTAVPQNPNEVCNDSAFLLVEVVAPPPAPIITGDTLVCANSDAVYCATGTGTINWIITGGTPATAMGSCITVSWGASGPFAVEAYQQLMDDPFCLSDTATLNVTDVTTPPAPSISGPVTACANGTTGLSTATTYPAGASYAWSLSPSNAGTITSGQGTPSIMIEWGNNAPQTVTVTLMVTVCGQTVSANHNVSLNPAPAVTIAQLNPLCFGGSAQLQASGTGLFSWTGPGGFTAAGNPVTIFVEGLYHVTLTDVNGCSGTSQIDVQYVSGPIASISTGDPTTHCIGSSYTVTICALGNVNYTYSWSTGATTQCITVAAPGSYSVTITDVTNNCQSVSNVITVSEITCGPGGSPCQPNGTVSFTASACNPFTFTNTSVGAFDFQWSFGDGNTSTLTSPTHTYADAGLYMVVLCGKVIATNGTDTCQLYDTAQIRVPLAAKFDVVTGCSGDPVCFTDKSATTPGTTITSWNWNFGDGNFAILPNPCHSYASPGTYIVTLTITGTGTSCTSVFTDTIVVPPPPTAAFSFSSPCCAGVAAKFTDASSPAIKTWSWDFGDGGTSLNQNPTHSYASSGSYPVTLIVCDSLGCCDTTTITKVVNGPAISGSITAFPDTIACEGETIGLVAPPCTTCTYLWNTGSTNDSLLVTSTGIYTVTMNDTSTGCPYSTFIRILVHPKPPAAINNIGKDELCLGEFTNLTVPFNINYNYLWISNDAAVNGSTSSTVFVNPAIPGTYNYEVIVTDTSTGCFDTSLVRTVLVHPIPPVPTITALGSSTICSGDTVVLVGTHPDTTVAFQWSTGEVADTIYATDDGCYKLTVVDTNGCENSATHCITVNPLPDLCMFFEGCYDTCAPYIIKGPPGTTWQWLLNGAPISGATSMNYSATVSGDYSVIVSNSFGCIDTTGVLDLTLYPCPDSMCADLVIDSVYCDSNGNYVMQYQVTNLTGFTVNEWALQVLPPHSGLGYAPTTVFETVPNLGTSTQQTVTIFNGSPGDSICFRTRMIAIDSHGVEVLCCPSDTACVVLPPCDSTCCEFEYLGDSVNCREHPAGQLYDITLSIDGCGTLEVHSFGGSGTLSGITNPYTLSGSPITITGTYFTTVDTILCLTYFLYDQNMVLCKDTSICIDLRCPPDTLSCEIEFDPVICEGQCASFLYTGSTTGVTVSWSWPGGTPSSATGPGGHGVCYSSPGVYPFTMTLTDANGSILCRDSVTVVPKPVATITQSGGSLFASPGSMMYQWTDGPPTYTPISGAINQFYTPTVQEGVFCVIVTDSFGCKDTACVNFHMTAIAGPGEASWSIFPNPNDGSFSLSVDRPIAGTLDVRILSSIGELVRQVRLSHAPGNSQYVVSNQTLPAGVYTIQLRSAGGITQKRMVVQ